MDMKDAEKIFDETLGDKVFQLQVEHLFDSVKKMFKGPIHATVALAQVQALVQTIGYNGPSLDDPRVIEGEKATLKLIELFMKRMRKTAIERGFK